VGLRCSGIAQPDLALAEEGDFRELSTERNHMGTLLCGGSLPYDGDGYLSGAQTERRGGAGPVRGLLGRKDVTGRLVSSSVVRRQSPGAVIPADSRQRESLVIPVRDDLAAAPHGSRQRDHFPTAARAQG